MSYPRFLDSLKILLQKHNQPVSELEITSGNYDNGKLIEEGVPTLTTDFCEIGIYANNLYFTVILYSDSFSKDLFNAIKKINNAHIYGFKKFMEDYYPTKNFSFVKLENQIRSEEYFQININFDVKKLTPRQVFKQYMEIKRNLLSTNARIVKQLVQDMS